MTKPAKQQSMFSSKHELVKMVSSLKKLSAKAIKVLELALESEDEKTRMVAAEKLLKFYYDSAKEVRQDEINNLIMQIKVEGLIGQGSTAEDDNTPVLDFDNLHPQFRDKVEDAQNVVDLSDVSKIG